MAASMIDQTIQKTALISVNRLDLPYPPKASEAIVRAKKWGCGVVTGGSQIMTPTLRPVAKDSSRARLPCAALRIGLVENPHVFNTPHEENCPAELCLANFPI